MISAVALAVAVGAALAVASAIAVAARRQGGFWRLSWTRGRRSLTRGWRR